MINLYYSRAKIAEDVVRSARPEGKKCRLRIKKKWAIKVIPV